MLNDRMLQRILLFTLLLGPSAWAVNGESCPVVLSQVLRFGRVLEGPQRTQAFKAIRGAIFKNFRLSGRPDLSAFFMSNRNPSVQRDALVAGRLAYHELKDGTTQVVEAESDFALTALANFGQLSGFRRRYINVPGDPVGLVKGIRNVLVGGGLAIPAAYFLAVSEPHPTTRSLIIFGSVVALGIVRGLNTLIRTDDPVLGLEDDHVSLHQDPHPDEWIYSAVNLPYYFEDGRVSALPMDAVSIVDSKGKPRTFFLVQPTPFRTYVEDNDTDE